MIKNLIPTDSFKKGDIIINEQSESPYNMYVVLKGACGAFRNYAQPQETFRGVIESGEFFGEMSVFLSEPHDITVVALDDVELFAINESNLAEVLGEFPELTHGIIKCLCGRIKELDDKLDTKLDFGL